MRTFHSYGPVEAKRHFYVSRKDLVERLIDRLIGDPQEGGITSPSGRQAKTEGHQRHGAQIADKQNSDERMRDTASG